VPRGRRGESSTLTLLCRGLEGQGACGGRGTFGGGGGPSAVLRRHREATSGKEGGSRRVVRARGWKGGGVADGDGRSCLGSAVRGGNPLRLAYIETGGTIQKGVAELKSWGGNLSPWKGKAVSYREEKVTGACLTIVRTDEKKLTAVSGKKGHGYRQVNSDKKRSMVPPKTETRIFFSHGNQKGRQQGGSPEDRQRVDTVTREDQQPRKKKPSGCYEWGQSFERP